MIERLGGRAHVIVTHVAYEVLRALVTGWLGGELVDRLEVGVNRGAHLDAPNSLSGTLAGGA